MLNSLCDFRQKYTGPTHMACLHASAMTVLWAPLGTRAKSARLKRVRTRVIVCGARRLRIARNCLA
jgi:hypothetical protein